MYNWYITHILLMYFHTCIKRWMIHTYSTHVVCTCNTFASYATVLHVCKMCIAGFMPNHASYELHV